MLSCPTAVTGLSSNRFSIALPVRPNEVKNARRCREGSISSQLLNNLEQLSTF